MNLPENTTKKLSWTQESDISELVWKTWDALYQKLDALSQSYEMLRQVQSKNKWYIFRQDTLEYIFEKYPNLSALDFEKYFLSWVYNKNILSCQKEIIDILDLENIEPGSDLIEIIILKISMSKEEFDKRLDWKLETITIPNMDNSDIAQKYFYEKLSSLLPDTQIIFWNMPEIAKNKWKNELKTDSIWFIDLLGNWMMNSCLLKLLKTSPDIEKTEELNDLFSVFSKDIFLVGSSYFIPFSVSNSLETVKMPKMEKSDKKPVFWKNWVLLNSMWYLNSAYYCDKVKYSFVLWSHNIAEPMHAGKMTVINNDIENRYNHNWLISYFWEKAGILFYYDGKTKEEDLESFLSLDEKEREYRNNLFQEDYKRAIVPLVYGILYNYLKKNLDVNFW